MSRKNELETIASLLGNAAAHAALLPEDDYARKEVSLYSTDAADIFLAKQWNEKELSYLKTKALARARTEIRLRSEKYGFGKENLEKFIKNAEEFIDAFVAQAKG
ncbi:MAG: hypothetical protein V1492_00925 [Candidatus Micrarchaeota archaeon]